MVELMLVLLVIAILLAIAIPTFLGSSKAANDRTAQANLNTALVDGNTVFQSNGQTFGIGSLAQFRQFATTMASSLKSGQPSLGFTTSRSSAPSDISISVSGGGNGIVMTNRSPTGTCWYAIDNPNAISATLNNAYKLRPYGTGKATQTATVTGSTGTRTLYLPSAAGNFYAEVTGDAIANDCSASNPKVTGSTAKYQIAHSTFPS